jgi:histidyl-tRNA synthetase
MSRPSQFSRLPGFRDFPPEELALRSHIFDTWRRVSRRYGFVEYDGPPLEELGLYTEKSGDEIVAQLYNFTDKGGREVALRPEMTPSLARMLAERSRALPKPIRWFSVPQLFRYERQQRGRLREHFQWNVDLIGADGMGAEAEVLAVALDSLGDLGLGAGEVMARVSDRRLLAAILASAGVREDRLLAAYSVIDKVEREGRERSLERLQAEVGLPEGEAERILGLFDAPGLEGVAEVFGGDERVASSLTEIQAFLGAMGELGFGDRVVFDLTIVRGLAYYTGLVFEVFDRAGEFRAICGGGRYDSLLERMGGESLSAVGFGMGDVVLSEILREREMVPDTHRSVDFYIVAIGEEQAGLARRIAGARRGAGSSVLYSLGGQSVRKQFSTAASEGARRTIVLGPDEVSRGVATLRDMVSGTEGEVSLDSLLDEGGALVPPAGGRPDSEANPTGAGAGT